MRPCGLLALALTACLVVTPAAAQEPQPATAQLLELSWRYDLLGSAERGSALLILFDPDSWRLEIGRTDQDEPRSRRGEGWTLAAPGDSCLYLQPWHGALETLHAGEAARLRALVRLSAGELPGALVDLPGLFLTAAAAERAGIRRWPWAAVSEPTPDKARTRLRWTDEAVIGLLARSETRGLGRGGADEIWSWQRSAGEIRLDSNRRPGRLAVRTIDRRQVLADPFEATLPVWTLEELDLEPVPD